MRNTTENILALDDLIPTLGRDVFVAPNAMVIGDVVLGDEASVWFGCVLRADVGHIRIGPRTNIQDLACCHMTGGLSQLTVGADVTVGHGAILHGATIEDECLIGMGAIVLDGAVIGKGSVVGAGALVTPRTQIPPGMLALGSPARPVRPVTDTERELGLEGARHYVENAQRYRRALLTR